jgi:hypothetical protein
MALLSGESDGATRNAFLSALGASSSSGMINIVASPKGYAPTTPL